MAATDARSSEAVEQKRLGAFYTPRRIARELTCWAIRRDSDTVLDPSFGGCAVLDAAVDRLAALGAPANQSMRQLHGVELDDQAFEAAWRRTWAGHTRPTLICGDFLTIRPGEVVPAVDAVVGNPPYLRYQGFNAGSQGLVSRLAAAAASVDLSRMASSWAAFLVHATRFVGAGGRLAHVLPGQFLHAQYAAPVREFLAAQFERVVVIAFEERVFPAAQEEVVLLLADGRGAGSSRLEFHSCRSLHELDASSFVGTSSARRRTADDRGKLLAELLPPATRALYCRLELAPAVRRLGELASVDIGTVTGANSFFLLSREASAGLHSTLLAPAVGRAAHVRCARFTKADYRSLLQKGARCRLLLANHDMPAEALESARDHLDRGEADGLHLRTKCRERNPWWAIKLPRHAVPDLFLTYCAHDHPRMIFNEARAMNTNTLHGVKPANPRLARRLVAGFYNSLTMLSSELLARSYGGGVLKLEPTEAEALLIPPLLGFESTKLLRDIDRFIRARDLVSALNAVDACVLKRGLGLTPVEITMLRAGAERLRRRRHARRRDPRT